MTKIVNPDGYVVVRYEYDAYGNILSMTGSHANTLGKRNSLTYRSYKYDREINLYYLNSRYYNPEIGRFISSDGLLGPVGNILGHNMYAYTQNNPVMMVDPSGEIAVVDDLLWGGIMAIAAVALIVFSVYILASTGTLDDLGNFLNDVSKTINDNYELIKTVVSQAIIAIAVATAIDFTKKYLSGYYVYQLKDIHDNVFYVGITKNLKEREADHRITYGLDFNFGIIAHDISLAQARVIETGLIALYTFDKLDNRRLSISNHRYVTRILLGKIESDLLLLIGR